MNAFFAALQFLTLFPRPGWMQHSPNEVGQSAIFFPVVGLLLGLILVLVNFLLLAFASAGLLSVILVTLLAFMTRGLHLDGLGDTFDGLGAGGDPEHVLNIMDDSHIGVFGLIAIVLVLFSKIHALESMDVDRWRALLVAPILGRWAMVLLAYRSTAAKAGLGSNLIEHLQTKTFCPRHFADYAFGSGDLSWQRRCHDGLGRDLHHPEQKLFSSSFGRRYR